MYSPNITMPNMPPTWYRQDDVIWIGQDDRAKKAAYRRVVDSGVPYLVREVHARAPGRFQPDDPWPEHTLGELKDVALLANDEFGVMRECGMAVAQVDWHVVRFGKRNRLIARVAIVDGPSLSDYARTDRRGYRQHISCIDLYNNVEVGDRLEEVDEGQFVVGAPRTEPAPPRLHMIDPEPIFY